jgi:hypothetical protein
VNSPGTRLGEAQCRRSREFLPPGRDLRPIGPSFGNSNPAAGGKRPRTGGRFHTASERDIPHYMESMTYGRHFDGVLPLDGEAGLRRSPWRVDFWPGFLDSV